MSVARSRLPAVKGHVGRSIWNNVFPVMETTEPEIGAESCTCRSVDFKTLILEAAIPVPDTNTLPEPMQPSTNTSEPSRFPCTRTNEVARNVRELKTANSDVAVVLGSTRIPADGSVIALFRTVTDEVAML